MGPRRSPTARPPHRDVVEVVAGPPSYRAGVRILIVGAVFAVLYALAHAVLPADPGGSVAPSAIVRAGLLPVAFILYGTAWFSLLGWVYHRLDIGRSGGVVARGLPFGAFLTVLVGVLYLEPLPGTVTLGATNLEWMAADALPLLAFGPLLAWALPTQARPRPAVARRVTPLSSDLVRAGAVVGAVALGRAISYGVWGIRSDAMARPEATWAWVLALGAVLALGYLAYRRWVVPGRSWRSAVAFTGVFLAAIYVPFNIAYLLVADVGWTGVGDFGLRLGTDLAFVAAGVLAVEWALVRWAGPRVRPTPLPGPA